MNDNKYYIKTLIVEGIREKSAEEFIKHIIKGTEWESKVFACGGYVRDELSGREPKDLDIVVDKPDGGILFSNWITKKIGNYKENSNPVIFKNFGTAKFNLNGVTYNGVDLTGFEIESVMPRSEEYTAGSRKPSVQQSTLKGDAERRDTTFNSLFKNISTGEILDLTGKGREDLEKGIIRTPIDPDKTFTDDALRMLRIVRFYAKYGYEIPMYIIKALKKNASQLQNISSERIQSELDKMLVTTRPDKALKLLKITGLLNYIVPEFKESYRMTQNKYHTKTVWGHTLDVLSKTQPVLVQRLMGLFHDIGKTITKTVEPETGGVHFYGHEYEGTKMVEDIMSRLKYPRELIDAVKLGVKNHMRLKQAGDVDIKIKDKTLLKFRNEMGEQLENILNLIHADNLSHAPGSELPNQITGIRQRLEKLKEIPTKPKMPISGYDLQELGLKPGPIFKEIMSSVAEAWYENPSLSKEQALEIAKRIAKI